MPVTGLVCITLTHLQSLREIISNSKLSEHFLALARDLDVMEAKTPEDVYKTHLTEGRAPAGAAAGGACRFVSYLSCERTASVAVLHANWCCTVLEAGLVQLRRSVEGANGVLSSAPLQQLNERASQSGLPDAVLLAVGKEPSVSAPLMHIVRRAMQATLRAPIWPPRSSTPL